MTVKTLLLTFFLLSSCLALEAQTEPITGTVTDARNNPVPATISVQSGVTAVVADASGRFSISSPAGSSLVVTATGYKTQTVSASSGIHILLEEDVARLDEVIVTSQSTRVKRSNLANAVATINATQLNGVAPAQTFDAALEGKISGAYINANTGAPGGGISVKLRGVTSVYGNTQPLYVVDGVFLDNSTTSAGLNAVTGATAGGAPTSNQDNASSRIADLRPEDIENIEVLKGASAAAIYGSRAAGGVIIITTKKGHAGKTKISFSQDLGFLQARHLLGVRTFTAERAASLSSDSARSVALAGQFTAAQQAGHIYDYEKEVFGHTGFTRNSVLSLSGGNDRTSFYFSAGQKDEGGIVKRTGYRNTGLRLNLDHRISDAIRIGVSTSYINSSADRGLTGNDNAGVSLGIALSSTPSFAQLHPDAQGNYPANPFGASNPLQTVALMKNNESVNRFIMGLNLEAILQKSAHSNTRFLANGGIDFYNLQTLALFPPNLQFQAVNKGTSIQGFTRNNNINYILSLNNSFTPSENFGLSSTLGFTQETGDYNNLLDVATQLISGQSNVNLAGALNATQLRNKYENDGLFLQEEATIFNGVMLTGGIRLDRSTNNGDPNKMYVYPKGSLSWNLTKLGWIKSETFDNIKLRAAYGQANNIPAFGSKYTAFGISNINGNPGVLVNTQAGDPSIKPERQTELETGIDFSLLKGRLSFELTYYNKKIFDFLMQENVPASTGFSTKWVNAGDLRNRGVEFGLNARPIVSRSIIWNSSVNFWLNRSLVTRLTIPPIPQGSFGYVLGSFQIEQNKTATQIVGLDGDKGVQKLGDAEPRFQMSTYNELTFFNKLSFRFLIHWKAGGQNVNLTTLQNDFGGTSVDFDKVTNKAGLPDGIYRISQVGTTARMFVQNSDYLKVREIGLYYRLPSIPSLSISGIQIGASLNNFITVTKYKSYDPEVSNFGTGFSTGVDVDPYPVTKRANFHVNIDF